MLVKYGCECVGFPADEHGNAWIVKSCRGSEDHDGPELYKGQIDKRNLKTTPVSPEEEKEIFESLQVLIYEGYRFRDLKRILS